MVEQFVSVELGACNDFPHVGGRNLFQALTVEFAHRRSIFFKLDYH
jgi:hypothetical protein